MRIIIAVAVSVMLALAIFFIAQKNMHNKIAARDLAKVELLQRGLEFINSLVRKDGSHIYQMFNFTFQKKFSPNQLQGAIDHWYAERSYRGVKFGAVNILGLSGHITSWISFKNSPETKLIYQYWIKTDSGWKLMWLTGILNYKDYIYGDSDTIAQHEIMQRMFEEAISDSGIKTVFQQLELTKNLAILYRPQRNFTKIKLPKNRVVWLTQDEIKNEYQRLGINTYFDFGMIRIVDGIALGTLDIVPIPRTKQPPGIRRRRSIVMFFKKVTDDWVFAGYGNKW